MTDSRRTAAAAARTPAVVVCRPVSLPSWTSGAFSALTVLRSPVAAALHSLAGAARRSTAAAVAAGRSCCGIAVLGIQTWRRKCVCKRIGGMTGRVDPGRRARLVGSSRSAGRELWVPKLLSSSSCECATRNCAAMVRKRGRRWAVSGRRSHAGLMSG